LLVARFCGARAATGGAGVRREAALAACPSAAAEKPMATPNKTRVLLLFIGLLKDERPPGED
jgi:hypothetical protein